CASAKYAAGCAPGCPSRLRRGSPGTATAADRTTAPPAATTARDRSFRCPGPSRDLHGQLHLDRCPQRQLGDPDGRPCVRARVTEDLTQYFGGTVDDGGLIPEPLSRRHVADNLHDPDHRVDVD